MVTVTAGRSAGSLAPTAIAMGMAHLSAELQLLETQLVLLQAETPGIATEIRATIRSSSPLGMASGQRNSIPGHLVSAATLKA